MEQIPDLEQLVAWVDQPDREALDLVTDAVILSGRLGDLADQVVDQFVQRAREDGASWAEIGASLGVSKQAAQKRYVAEERIRHTTRGGLFTRFDDSSRHAVQEAVNQARINRSLEITTLHLVLGLCMPDSGRASDAIAALADSRDAIRRVAEDSMAAPERSRKVRHIPFSDDCKKVLELALREAIHARSRSIGTEHVLLGLLRDEKSPGARLLTDHGVSAESVRTWLDQNRL